ncbi:ATP-binding protein [Lederbergia panacisoli]|uniref:ATP-binding protein n=1 Tax=Lederbergia panacisoli TaxID=1255251 RepID=UPI00214B2837|nr:ATP-binding protein [Lederbergia panacisoli]MCR2820038.1 ATP-binding protein [Lederbergia panacisoli]
MIKKFEVKNLNQKLSFTINFNNDLNILTGKNGTGKTSLLKLLWYLLSGKVDTAISELYFDYAQLETNTFKLEVNPETYIKFTYKDDEDNWVETEIDPLDNNFESFPLSRKREYFESRKEKLYQVSKFEKSVFFPTFRRIEGGFASSIDIFPRYRRTFEEELDEVMSKFSRTLSDENHLFITSISTNDIKELLTEKYTKISDFNNLLHSQMNKYITEEITRFDNNFVENASQVLNNIKQKVIEVENKKKERFRNFEMLSNIVGTIFEDKGIKLSDSITLGDTAKALSSNLLSAGEKQMLSFLCYNLFFDNSSIFIDEPEISLHVDWQRMFMNFLFSQETNNQYIITTHSPFILSKYSDKEILLSNDRGGDF